jgi:uncharacterized protein (TIGR02246 family)
MSSMPLVRSLEPEAPLRGAFDRYHAAWESLDADAIAERHTPDSVFVMHDGSAPVQGRDHLRQHFAGLFARYTGLAFDPHRVLYGDRRWVFDYAMVVTAQDANGKTVTARLDMVDVVDVDAMGLVARKEVFVDVAQMQRALAALSGG